VADYFDRLELELRAAVPRANAHAHTDAHRLRPTRRRPRPGNVFVAISAAVTIAVVVLGVALIGHGHTASAPFEPARPRPPATGTAPQSRAREVRDVLAGNGIATAKFGESRAAVTAALTPLLGAPVGGYKRFLGECGIDHKLQWREALTVTFSRSRFVGYQYFGSGTSGAPSGQTALATTRGLNIGDTLAHGRRLYGASFTISAAQGGSWRVTTPRGRLEGYASEAPTAHSALSPQNLVASIAAGNVGCAALTP